MVAGRVPFLSLDLATAEVRPELELAVSRVVTSGNYIGGPEVDAFESEFAAFVGAKYCVGVGNGLDAITLSLLAHGLQRGDEVLVPSNTFIATWLAVTHAGGVPVPVQPDFGTYVVTPEACERAITPRTRAICPVHLYGMPVEVPAFRELCARRGLFLVEDAAQAHGASLGGTLVGGFGTTATWSFYPGKNLGAFGDAGAVTTDDKEVAASLRQLRNYGSTEKYVHETVGFNSRLDPIQAAVLRVKLAHLPLWNERRRVIAARYLAELSDLALQLPAIPNGRESSWHLFVVRTSRRDELRKHLKDDGIDSIIHYPQPPHRQAAYAGGFKGAFELEETVRAANEVLSLPMGPHLSIDQQARVIASIRAFF